MLDSRKIVYTIVTPEYFSNALALGESFYRHHSNYQFIIVVVSDVKIDEIEKRTNHKIIYTFEMLYDFPKSFNYNTIPELCFISKVFSGKYIYHNFNPEVLVYLDSDILVFDRLTEMEEALNTHDIILTPHTLSPIPDIDHSPMDTQILGSGLFNAGFFAVKKSEEAFQFLNWWTNKVMKQGLQDQQNGMFGDQLWLNFVVIYFTNYYILKHPGYNVAGYNLHERVLSKKDDDFWVNDQYRLKFYHYTGYSNAEPLLLSKYQTRYTYEERQDLWEILKIYNDKIFSLKLHFDIQNKTGYEKSIPDPIPMNTEETTNVSDNKHWRKIIRKIKKYV